MLPHILARSLGADAAPEASLSGRAVAGWSAPRRPTKIGIALFPGAEELDWAGPWEVFAYWADRWPDEAEVFSVAPTLDPIRCARGLRILPDREWKMAPLIDVLIYPGGRGARAEMLNAATTSRLRQLRDGGALLASVCTGSLVFAAAGLLDGRAATTHHDALEDLRSLGRGIDVRATERFVDADGVITAAGVSAGIDMSIYLVGRLHSAGRADAVRRAIEYRTPA